MEIASNKGVIADASTPAGRAGMSESEWREAIKFDSTDTGWVIMSIGMAIGAGIVFLPVQVGLMGLWVFLLSSVIGYPAMYLFQRLFINTLAESPECKDYPSVISGYLGKNWGILLGALYFVMLVIWMFVYSTAITNDSASYLHTFGVTEGLLSDSPFYGLVLICILVAISSRGEKLLFKISTGMVLTKLLVVAALGVSMVGMWHLYNVGSLPPLGLLVKNAIITLPFTLTSILFIQTLSPMVISYRSREKSIEVARHKALRAMNIAFGILFVTVFFYAVSFTLAMGHDEAVKAYEQNISALAIAAQFISGDGAAWVKVVSVILNIFAVMTAFFGVYLGFREAIVTEALVPTPAFFPLIDKLAAKANTQLAIITEVLAGAWERLEQGRADIVIAPDMHFRSSSEINSRKLYTLMNVYVAAPDHPIHQEPEPLSEVTRVKYRGIAVADTARERPVLTVQLLDKQPRLTVSTIEDKRQALLAGLGVATMPYPMVEKDIAEGRLRVVSPESTSEIDIIMAWRRDSMGEAKSWCLREIPKLFSGK